MSQNLTQAEAQRIFAEIREHEAGGCTTFCVSRSMWNSSRSSGSDHRKPSEVVARYIWRTFGVKVDENGQSIRDYLGERGARLSDSHPYTIVWDEGSVDGHSVTEDEEDVFAEEDELSEVRR